MEGIKASVQVKLTSLFVHFCNMLIYLEQFCSPNGYIYLSDQNKIQAR